MEVFALEIHSVRDIGRSILLFWLLAIVETRDNGKGWEEQPSILVRCSR